MTRFEQAQRAYQTDKVLASGQWHAFRKFLASTLNSLFPAKDWKPGPGARP